MIAADPNEVQAVAESVLQRPAYVMLQSAGAVDHLQVALGHSIMGSWGRGMDLSQRAWLQERGDWHGRRPSLYLHDETICKTAADVRVAAPPVQVSATVVRYNLHDFMPQELVQRSFLNSIVAHEVGHILECEPDLSEPTPQAIAYEVSSTAYSAALINSTSNPPWFQHGPLFIRMACHAMYRIDRAGFPIFADSIFIGDTYSLPCAMRWVRVLWDECEQLASVPPFDLKRQPVSEAFATEWRDAMSAWRETNPPAEQLATAEKLNYLEFELCPS